MQGRSGTSRPYDAERTKRAILDAAEEAFANAGFSGARIDAIAQAAGCNKSLIYQYVGDKLALYTAVVKRVDEAGAKVMESALVAALHDSSTASEPTQFRSFLTAVVGAMFQFLFEHPRYVNILFWEAAGDWSTWDRLSYRPDDASELIRLVEQAQEAGVVRPDFDPALFPPLVMTSTAGLMRFARRFTGDGGSDSRNVGDGEAESRSAESRVDGERHQQLERHLRDQAVSFLLHGMLHPKHFRVA